MDGSPRLVPYTAPTWSWASLPGYIIFPTDKKVAELEQCGRIYIEVYDIYIKYASSNLLGEIFDANFVCVVTFSATASLSTAGTILGFTQRSTSAGLHSISLSIMIALIFLTP
jgi:hypothetical protein